MATIPPLPRGAVPLDPSSAMLLGRLAVQLGRPAAATVAPAPIEELETVHRTAIPYDVLAVLAVEQRSLGDVYEITSEAREYYDVTDPGDADYLGFDKVALFARLPGDPAEPSYAGFDKTTRRDRASIVCWVLRKPGVGRNPWSLDAYVAERWQLAPGDAQPFALTIEAPPEVVRHASHAKFGRGRVVSRADGKAVIEFVDATRTLAERFLVFDD